MKDIYICFSNIDHDDVFPAAEAIEAAGFSCCIPGRDFEMGPDWEEYMTDAVYSATMLLYFDSEAARNSRRIRRELEVIQESGLHRMEFRAGEMTADRITETVYREFPKAREIKRLKARLLPYTGNEPYIFLSYAHRNIEKVFPLIRILQNAGYRIWFDEGIDPGTEWADNIAQHLESARYLMACMSREYLESTNCCDELSFARQKGLPILIIFLEPVRPENGNELRTMSCPSVGSPCPGSEESFLDTVCRAVGIQICRTEKREDDADV